MKCGFCGKDIPDRPDDDRTPCGVCPGGCRKVHCPHCGYANPVLSGRLKRWLGEKEPEKKD